MDDFARSPARDRADAFREAVARGAPGNELIVEKDFWVCWTLQQLTQLPDLVAFSFKGGTSLSKAFRLIRRFSEDIDIVLDPAAMGFGGVDHPRNLHGKARKRQLKALKEATQQHVAAVLIPALKSAKTSIDVKLNVQLDPTDEDAQTILIEYPRALESAVYGGTDSYIRPRVKLEIGARGDTSPSTLCTITPYVFESLPEAAAEPHLSVPTLTPARTYWEKICILHKYAHADAAKFGARGLSRHYADVCALHRGQVTAGAMADLPLLDDVRVMNEVMFPAQWARFERAVIGSLVLLPADEHLRRLEDDYRAMAPMFFEPPESFDQMINALRSLEELLNSPPRPLAPSLPSGPSKP